MFRAPILSNLRAALEKLRINITNKLNTQLLVMYATAMFGFEGFNVSFSQLRQNVGET